MEVKKYIVFAWGKYEPSGGINDLIGSFDNIEDAFSYCNYERFKLYDDFSIVRHSDMAQVDYYYRSWTKDNMYKLIKGEI